MKSGFRNFITHFFSIAFFALVALLYFNPVLQGKVIYQSDIIQYRGMAEEQEEFRRQYEQEPYWTNSAFGGMPTYQLGARYPHDYIKKLDRVIRFLPRPADYLFLYFLLALNEYAYLAGNIGLFIGLASVMWFTSRTEIFKRNEF